MADIWIDPPSGWLYGFPKRVPSDANICKILLDSSYPKEDVYFALRHLRVWPAIDKADIKFAIDFCDRHSIGIQDAQNSDTSSS